MPQITGETLSAYKTYLHAEERGAATVKKYLCDAAAFAAWLGERELTKEAAVAWKEHLSARGDAPGTVNGKLSALNGLLKFLGREDCRVKLLHIQRRLFREEARELSREEYARLVEAAWALGKERTALLLEAVCGTGVRVSEVRYITVEALRRGQAEVRLKGKIRVILFPRKLAKKLLKYAQKNKIASGEIFLTRSGRGLSRRQIWAEMKALCGKAGIEPTKVFPHNLRHLFARTYYKMYRDVVRLASVLGHSSIETTRIYLLTTGEEHLRQLELLRLVS